MAVGKALPMLDAVARVDGSLPYVTNLQLPGMLVGKALRSVVPHAQITRLDVSAAERLAGVVAVVTAHDFAGDGPPHLVFGSGVRDQPVVAAERIRYLGEPVVLVAAETAAIADAALDLIELSYEELPAVFEPEAALAPGAPLLHESFPNNCLAHTKLRHGDVEAGFAAADFVVAETFTSPVAQQVALEPQAAIARWGEGRLTVWTASQSPYTVRKILASIFGLDPADVRVIVPPLGGGFGAKGNVRTQPMAAALAWKSGGRPVKMVLSRAEEFVTVTKHAARIVIKSGIKADGTLTARQVTVYWNGGAYASSSAHLAPAGMLRAIGPYRIPAVHVDSYGVYTNLPAAAAYRGAMSSQGTFAYESHMDTLARRVGMDPLAIRLKNLLVSGDHFATGEVVSDVHYTACLQAVAKGIGWQRAGAAENREADAGAGVRRGRGLAVMNKHTMANSLSQCRLRLNAGGQVTLYTSTVEMGQGAHTALAQIAAEALAMPMERIQVCGPDTDETPPDAQTAASRSTYMMGNAVLEAVKALQCKLLEAAVPILEYPSEQLSAGEGHVFVNEGSQESIGFDAILQRHGYTSLEALGTFETNVGQLDPETGQGVSTPHWHQGAGACEVAVDTETGKVTVLRYHSASFAGRVVNPLLASLQNDGNVIYGLGATLFEEMILDGGQVTNANLADYMIPSIRDIPAELVNYLLEAEGSAFHGIGEMTLPPASPAIANAVYDAIGVRIRELPLTPEKVLQALHNKKVIDGS